jgi:hypothetical protein
MSAGTSAAVHAAVVAQAIKASGSIVRVSPNDFALILARSPQPLVVRAEGRFFSKKINYLTSYKGLTFYTSSASELELPGGVEVVTAERIWIPQ